MTRKVLLIGWDAADWQVINDLIEQGRMPHTQRLIERGVMGDLTTLQPVLSPMLWTTIATGKRPYDHGILGFTEPTPDGGGVQPVSQFGRTTKALWNILHQQGLRQHVIGWWPSHPVEPIDGVMVSNHYHTAVGPPEDPWPLAAGMVHPARVAETLAELRLNPNELLPEQVLPFVPLAAEIDQDQDRRLAGVMKILAECTSMQAAALWAMEHEPWDFMGVYFDAIDHFCHGFMRYRAPRRPHIPARDFELYKGVVDMGYCYHDLMLGAMLERAGADTTVIICSDHGFHADHLRPVRLPKEPAGPAIEHRDLGMLIMAGPGIRRDALIHGASVLDVTPTILALYGMPVGEDMHGKVLVDAFEQPPQVATLPSWDAVPGDAARLDTDTHYDPIAAKEAMDQLVALGYVEAPGEDMAQAVQATVRELRYNLARSYMDGGRHVDAVPLLSALYAAEPEQFRFGVQLAMCYRALGLVPELRALIERLTEDRRAAAVKAGAELDTLSAVWRARQAAAGELAVGEDGEPEIDPARLTEAEQQRYDELRLLARFNTYDLDYLMGWVLSAEGQPDAALEHLRRAEQANATRPGLHLQIGDALFALRRLDEAAGAFAKALALDPRNPPAPAGLARRRLRQRRNDEALEHALASVNALYQNPVAHYLLGLALLRRKQYLRAAEALRVAVGINPNFERAHRVLALYTLKFELDTAKSKEHWRLVREIRQLARTRRLTRVADAQIMLEGLSEQAAPEVDQEGRQIDFDAAPRPQAVADKSAVPAHWRECITIVSGLPRAGTSMAMQMLAAGGIAPVTDGKRAADRDNPKGYFELEAATALRQKKDWLTEAKGGVVKIVAQLLPSLPPEHHYRILFMERDLDEVVASQQAMLDRLGRERAQLSDEQLKAAYRRQLRQIGNWLARRPNVQVEFARHAEILADPGSSAQRIADFLGGDLDTGAMAAAVDPQLYRQRHATVAA